MTRVIPVSTQRTFPMKAAETHILDSIAGQGFQSPKSVTLAITNNCNLSCMHCLPDSAVNGKAPSVPATAINNKIEEFTRLGAEEICLTGGEPLTHPDWFEILAFACRQPGLKNVRLQTNGTLLTETAIKALCSIQSTKLVVQVSLEGSTAATNDRVRGNGSFEQVIRSLALLAVFGLSRQVVVAFTEMQHNFDELPDVFRLVDRFGIGHLVSGTLFPGGRAVKNDQISPPEPSQYKRLLAVYHSDPHFKSLYGKIGNIAAIEWFKGQSYPLESGCNCIDKPYINALGEMYPCILMPIEKLAVKNAYQLPLDEVLLQGLSLWSDLPRLLHIRAVGLESCSNCPGRQHCAGGCMGRAYAATGNFTDVEDRCTLRKAVYSWKSQIRLEKTAFSP